MSGPFSREVIEHIRGTAAIENVAARYTLLRGSGDELEGLCPIHDEKRPSFRVSPKKARWYCFGCGNGGDVFALVEEIEKLGFLAAVRRVAELVGTPIDGTFAEPSREQRCRIAEYKRRQFDRELELSFDRFERFAFLLAALERDDTRERIAWLGTLLDWGFVCPELAASDWYSREREQAECELTARIDRQQILDERLRIITDGTEGERLGLYDAAS